MLERKLNRAGGFNLIEVVIVVTIAGILAAVAAPSFRSFITSQRVKTASFDVLASLTLARSEAIKRNSDVSMVPASGGWSNGWTIVSGTTTLQSKSAYSGRCITEATGTDCTTASTLTFGGNGRLKTSATAFTIGTSPLTATADIVTRCVTISLSGQASSKLKGTGTGAC